MDIAIRYLNADGELIYEESTNRPWSRQAAEQEKKRLLAVGPPPMGPICQAQIVPLLVRNGEGMTLTDMAEGPPDLRAEAAALLKDPQTKPLTILFEE